MKEESLYTLSYRRLTFQDASFNGLSIYEALYGREEFSFFYESLEDKEKKGRYSFIGGNPFLIFKSKGKMVETRGLFNSRKKSEDPLDDLKKLIKKYKIDFGEIHKTSTFSGGAVGYIGYDFVHCIEKLPQKKEDEINVPDMFFIFPREIIILDNKENTVDIITYYLDDGNKRSLEIKSTLESLSKKKKVPPKKTAELKQPVVLESNFTQEAFEKAVDRAKEYIVSGDIFQVVISQRFKFANKIPPLDIYKALRAANPSPYMYYLRLEDVSILGSSPEILVKLTKDQVTIRPLAGTRPRGGNPKEDEELKKELLLDEKEKAEHIMLVDLSRNDIGRVCEFGSVKVAELLEVEKFSKVMHIVSNVEGRLRGDKDSFDLLKATFPAGTVSGAPKIRAMEIINELEPENRGIYAGSIGYFDFSGNMDMCIAIRTIIIKEGTGYIQAGAGIVADSVPEKEYQETLNKAVALKNALEIAGGSHDPGH